MPSNKVIDFDYDVSDFEELLECAERAAYNDYITRVIDGIRNRFDNYGVHAFLSDSEHELLLELASKRAR